MNNFERFSNTINTCLNLDIIKDDSDDNKFLECAVSGAVNYIISGDIHLKSLK